MDRQPEKNILHSRTESVSPQGIVYLLVTWIHKCLKKKKESAITATQSGYDREEDGIAMGAVNEGSTVKYRAVTHQDENQN